MASVNVLNGVQYSTLAKDYGNLLAQLQAAASVYLYNAVLTIADLQEVQPEVDLLITFNNVYTQQYAVLTSNSGLLDAVRALNQHIINRARNSQGNAYTNINDYFADQELAGYHVGFPQQWADMSLAVGFNVEEFVGP